MFILLLLAYVCFNVQHVAMPHLYKYNASCMLYAMHVCLKCDVAPFLTSLSLSHHCHILHLYCISHLLSLIIDVSHGALAGLLKILNPSADHYDTEEIEVKDDLEGEQQTLVDIKHISNVLTTLEDVLKEVKDKTDADY